MRSLIRHRDPFSVFDDMRRTFNDTFSDLPDVSRTTPDVDIKKEDDRYVVEADLPGMSEKDIDVRVEDNSLIISSEKEEKREEEEEEGYLVKERRRQSFRRRFSLPTDADQGKIDAKFQNGVLTLDIPRKESEKKEPKKIEVKGS